MYLIKTIVAFSLVVLLTAGCVYLAPPFPPGVVSGTSDEVLIENVYMHNQEDALELAQRYCQQYGKPAFAIGDPIPDAKRTYHCGTGPKEKRKKKRNCEKRWVYPDCNEQEGEDLQELSSDVKH
jgi:hypothetical protein